MYTWWKLNFPQHSVRYRRLVGVRPGDKFAERLIVHGTKQSIIPHKEDKASTITGH